LGVVVNVGGLSLSTIKRDDNVSQMARLVRCSDERPEGLAGEGQDIGWRIYLSVATVQFAQRIIAGHCDDQRI
jgi:hypothetical protein